MVDEKKTEGEEQPPKLTIRNGNGAGSEKPKPPATVEVRKPASKSETSRIELSEAEPPPAVARPGEPMSVKQVLGEGGDSGKKKTATSRIELDQAQPAREDDAVAVAKDSTVRLDLTETGAVKPAQGQAPVAPEGGADEAIQDAQKNRTARIRIEEEPSAEEERSATARIELEGTQVPREPPRAQPPRTVRLQRAAVPPKTVVLSRPEGTAPKTVVLKKPSEDGGESDKGATSRISVPEGALEGSPPTQRKTIRIKRSGAPSSAGAKTLTVARPSKASPTMPQGAEEQLQEIMAEVGGEPGTLFSVLALVAMLVIAVLVYVLAAQTVAPNLPFPGRVL